MNIAADTGSGLPPRPAYPLSAAQIHMWLGHAVSPDQSWYNVGAYGVIEGVIDPAILAAAIRYNISDTASLRLVFLQTAQGPSQRVLPYADCAMPLLDLRAEPDPMQAALSWMRDDAVVPFDLGRGPLLRYALLRLSAQTWILYGLRHHLITDAFSAALSERHLAALYTWLVKGGERPLPPASSLDLLDEDHAYRASGQEARDRAFWHAELQARPESCTLSGRSPLRAGRQIHASITLPHTTTAALSGLGHTSRSGLAAVIMTAVAIYLSRMTGKNDLVLGMPVINRPSPKLRRIAGMTANILPVRLHVDQGKPFAGVLDGAARRIRAALRHQRYPSGALRQDLGLTAEQHDIYGTLVSVLPLGGSYDFAGACGRMFHLANGRADDLLITAYPANDGRALEIVFSANAANYTAETLAHHMSAFRHLLEQGAAAPDRIVSLLNLMTDESRAILLAPSGPSPLPATLLGLFEAQAARRPEALAILCGDDRLTYGALDARAARLARRLRHAGIGSGSLVGVCISRTPDAIAGLLGIMKAGGAFVPLDLAMPAARLRHILDESRLACVLVAAADAAQLPPGLPFLSLDESTGCSAPQDGGPAEADPSSPLLASHLAYVIFTSGSSGAPKGVLVSHRGIAALAASHVTRFATTSGSRVLQFASLAFDASIAELATAWGCGAALVLAPPGSLSGPALGHLMETALVSHATLPPAVLATLTPRRSSLVCLAVAGESCRAELAAAWTGLTRVINAYGPTEATVCVTLSEDLDGDGVPIGRAIPGARIYVLDAALEPVPAGVAGEIYIAGESVALGYLNQPGLTAAHFVADPFGSQGGRMYRSGDRGRWRTDGQLEFLGRADRQLKIRGMRVEPSEIEAVLRSLPEVDAALVVAWEDRPRDIQLVAYLVPSPGCTIDPPHLHSRLAGRLQPHMLPSAFVTMTALPLNASGKLDRNALPRPDRTARAASRHAPPEGALEADIVAIWQELLGLDQIGRHDNFFALGGHSLLLIALAARLRQHGWTTDFAAFFGDPTPMGLAATLTEIMAEDASGNIALPPLIPPGATAITPEMVPLAALDQADIDRIVASVPGRAANLQDIYKLSPLQEGIVFHHRIATRGDVYVTSALLAVTGATRWDRFESALQVVIGRHDVLRTAFLWEGLDEPVQVVWRQAELRVDTVGGLRGDIREALWRAGEPGTRIDLRQAPLLRLQRAWDVPRGEWCVKLSFHHAVADHLTVERIFTELRLLMADEDAILSPAQPFRSAVLQARALMADPRHADFFRHRLGDIDTPTAPFGVRHLEPDGAPPEDARLVIAPALAAAIRQQAAGSHVTCAALFHAAWALVLERTTGRQDVVFGTVLSGRLQGSDATAAALGLLANTLPLRLSLRGVTAAAAVREVQARLAELLAHEQAPLALAQSCSGVALPAPLFTTLLNYRHSAAGGDFAGMEAFPSEVGLRVLRTQERSHYPFMLAVDETGQGFELVVQAPRHPGASTIAALMETALDIVTQALADAPATLWESLGGLAHTWPTLPPHDDMAISPAPPVTPMDRSILATQAAALSPTQALLAEIWRGVLGIPVVLATDDFFAVGGHSLSALRVTAQLRERLGIDLPLKTLFACRSLAALADWIDQDMQDGSAASTILPPIRPCAPDGAAPLSHAQERMWLIQSLAPESSAYNMSAGLLITGTLDDAALGRAVSDLCERHEVLRSVIRTVDDQPMQLIDDTVAIVLGLTDLRGHGAQALPAAIGLAERVVRAPYDLAHDRMLRAALFRLEDEKYLLALVVHHVVADQWSVGLLGRELAALYNGEVRGGVKLLETPQIGFRDYAVWQRRHMQASDLADHIDFWRTRLADLPTLALPTDRPHPALPSFRGAVHLVAIPPALSMQVTALGRRTGATLFMIMLSGWAALLHRLTAQADIAIAVPVANRAQSATEDMVGTFVNTVVLRTDLSGNPGFDALVQRVRATALDAFSHQEVPFDWLVKEIAQRRNANRAPLAQVMFNVANTPMDGIAFDGLDWTPLIFDRGGAQFDLGVTIDVAVSGMASFEYSTDVFDRGTVERIAAAYFTLLQAACDGAGTPIGALAMVPEADLAQLRAWNDTAAAVPPDATYPLLFQAQAARTPQAFAVSCQGETLTYADLDAQSDALARLLRSHGAAPGLRVALCVPRTLVLPVALIAILKSGAAYVPLDPDYPVARLSFMLADSGATLLLTADGCADGIDRPDCLHILDLGSLDDSWSGNADPQNATPAGPPDTAYVIYTSGSTGKPKGVVIPHGALVNFLLSMAQSPGLSAADVMASVTTVSFDIAGLEIFLPLMLGAAVELVPRAVAADGVALAGLLAASGATVMQATPATWRLLLEADWRPNPGFRVFCGGEALPRELADALLDRAAEVWNLYGPTETTIWSSLDRVTRDQPITIGRPIANTQIHLLDQNGAQMPIGFAGEICIGGAGVALGYLNRPELTAERFREDPYDAKPGARLYCTGDIGVWTREGRLLHLGRSDQQVKIRGFRIETGEIETELAAHPSVRQAVVVAREAQPGDPRLVAYLLYRDGEDLTASEVRRHLRHSLPDFMIPSVVVALESLPLTPNGKLDRGALPDPFKASHRALAKGELPSPGPEQAMAGIWRSVLGVDDIYAEDNFFEIGGHSLLALRVSVAVRQQTGLRLDPRTLFFHSLRQLVGMAVAEGGIPPS